MVMTGEPDLLNDAPVSVRTSRRLFAGGDPHAHYSASLAQLGSGRLVLVFSWSRGVQRQNNGVMLTSRTDDDGATWTTPEAIYAKPGWDCMHLGGLMPFSDTRLLLGLGRIQMDPSLPGDEPCTGWYMSTSCSADGGETWGSEGPEIRLFPEWSELYGASNPHRLDDGRHMLAVIGTTGRDSGWQAGVCFTDDEGESYSAPVIVASHPKLGFGDMDITRLADGRHLAVARVFDGNPSVIAYSGDDGLTWTEPRAIEFWGANIKLQRLRSGALLCAYRDEQGNRSGVGCSVSEDDGASWRRIGWLASPSDGPPPAAGDVRCGYPDMARLRNGNLGCVLAPSADADGIIDLRWLELVDRT